MTDQPRHPAQDYLDQLKAEKVAPNNDPICECPKCGRMHRSLGFGPPPSLPHHTDLCALSVLVQRHMRLDINQPGYRLNEWLKQFLEVARRGDPRTTKAEEAAKKVVPFDTARTYTLEELEARARQLSDRFYDPSPETVMRLVADLIATLRAR